MTATVDNDRRQSFTTSEVARYVGVTSDTVLRWIKSRKLRAFSTPGGHHRVIAEELRGFLRKHHIPVDETFFKGRAGRTVLVVGSADDGRRLIRDELVQLDPSIRVEEAAEGYEAGIKIGQLLPDLVVLDGTRPDVDGLLLCRVLRANRATCSLRVLAVVGFADGDQVRDMYEAGADVCVSQPLRHDEFRREAARLLGEVAREQGWRRGSRHLHGA